MEHEEIDAEPNARAEQREQDEEGDASPGRKVLVILVGVHMY